MIKDLLRSTAPAHLLQPMPVMSISRFQRTLSSVW